MTRKPRYFFQLEGYMSPADKIAGRKSTFRQRTALRFRSRMRQAQSYMIRVGMWTGDVY